MKNKDSRIRPKHFLLVLIGLCLILIIVSTVSSTVNNGVRNVINTVLMPMPVSYTHLDVYKRQLLPRWS